jgi:hypothetical protein
VWLAGGWLRVDGVMVGWLAQKASSLVNNNSWPSGWLVDGGCCAILCEKNRQKKKKKSPWFTYPDPNEYVPGI